MSGRTSIARWVQRAAALVLLARLAPAGSRDVTSCLGPNQPPELEIVDARGGRNGGGAGLHVRWAARDPEGRLAPTHWRLSPWVERDGDAGEEHTTTLEECLLQPDRLANLQTPGAAREPLRFTVWAVDAAGARSEPATLALFPGNIAPTVMITAPVPSIFLHAQVAPDVCIMFTGNDPDGVFTQKPVKYKYELLDLDDPANTVFVSDPDSLRRLAVSTNWAGWDSTSADSEHVTYTNLIPRKSYMFVVTGWDEAGDYDPVFSLNKNMLTFTVNFPGVLGPRIAVTGPAFRFEYESGGWSIDPLRVIHTEVASGAPLTFQWSALPVPGQQVAGYRWVVDPASAPDQTPDEQWSEWGPATSVTLRPLSALGPKREEHTLYIEARSNTSSCGPPGSDFVSLAIVHFVVVKPTFDKELLVVDDTRLEPDRFNTLGCPNNYTGRWPSAAELDTFLYARGGVPWRCTKNPTTGVLSLPGILAGYSFDTTGTRGVRSGRQVPGGVPYTQSQAIPLSVLANYKHVLWLTDGFGAFNTNSVTDAVNPITAMRYMSAPGAVNVLNTYIQMGGSLWLAGGGTAYAALRPYDKLGNNTGQTTRFSSAPPWNELASPNLIWQGPHLRSEISVTTAIQAARALGRFESAPGPYGALPLALESRTTATDPMPPTRTVTSQFYYTTRQVEFVTQPNHILEDSGPVLDSLYVVQGSGVPIGTGNVAMTVYHGSEGGQCIWTGFDLWSFQRSQCIQLVDGVLQGVWGLSRAPVPRTPAGAPAFEQAGPLPGRPPVRAARATRVLPVR